MTTAELAAMRDFIVAAVKTEVALGLAGLSLPVAERGEKGEPGDPGRDGRDGRAGIPSHEDLKFEVDKAMIEIVSTDIPAMARAALLEARAADPWPVYRDVWREGDEYEKAAVVTWAGSSWIALAATTERPGDGATSWKLFVKRGARGRDGDNGRDAK